MKNAAKILKLNLALLISIVTLVFLSSIAHSEKVYLNDTTDYPINAGSQKLFELPSNLTIYENISHTFEGKLGGGVDQYSIQYFASNLTGFLLDIEIQGSIGTSDDEIVRYSCDRSSYTEICNNGCGIGEFGTGFHEFSIIFDASASNAKIFIDGVQRATADLCMNFIEVGGINISSTIATSNVKNNLVTADNQPPQFISNLPNIIWDEDTSTSFNISGNFSDSNNDALTYTHTNVEDISISINNATGIANLTPSPDFFGIRYAVFYANDGSNATASNNVTLTVTNVNDAPTITSVSLSNSDFENRTNGTLTASWQFSDIDGDAQQGNETLWHVNGVENVSLRNLTAIGSGNTTKGQNWSFSIRVFDGTTFSEMAYSLNTTIQNSLQYFNPVLGIIQAERSQLLVYDINYTDLDGDNVTFYDNSSLFNITIEGIINFTPAAIGNITVNATMSQSPNLNPNVSGILTIEVADTLPPIITAISTSNSGTNPITVTLSATTDEIAICRFSTSPADNFTNMTQMSSTNSASHSTAQSFNSDTSGTYYAMCNDTYGNVMNYSNSTAFNADVQESSGGNTGGGGGGGAASNGKSGRECKYKWECSGWSECKNGKQARNCEKVRVMPFYSGTECDSEKDRETSRECEEKKAEEPKIAEEPKEESKSEEKPVGQKPNQITGRAIFSGLTGKIKNPGYAITAILILIALFVSLYFRYFQVPSSELSEEELKRLHKQLESQLKKGL